MDAEQTFERQRAELVATLRREGIRDEAVLRAIGAVRRERFVPEAVRARAYANVALEIGRGQTISQPYTVAVQTAWLEVAPGNRVLEVGTGSGYQAAVLVAMGMSVWSVERLADLAERARAVWAEVGAVVTEARVGDGSRGWPERAPFDAIVVTAAAREVPAELPMQLAVPTAGRRGGRLVVPVGGEDGQRMVRVERTGGATWARETSDWFRFVPLVTDADGGGARAVAGRLRIEPAAVNS